MPERLLGIRLPLDPRTGTSECQQSSGFERTEFSRCNLFTAGSSGDEPEKELGSVVRVATVGFSGVNDLRLDAPIQYYLSRCGAGLVKSRGGGKKTTLLYF